MRLLHISDLHVRSDTVDHQRPIIDGMLARVREAARKAKVDAVIFSGDLAYAGKREEYELAHRLLLQPVMKEFELSPAEVVLAPGNHDIDRDSIDHYLERGLQAELTDGDAVNLLVADSGAFDDALRRLATWKEFCDEFYDGYPVQKVHPLGLSFNLECENFTVGIAALNTAWRATGAPDDADYGRLLLGQAQIRNSVEAIADCDARIVTMHHPLDWLASFDHEYARLIVERAGVLLLTGHDHQADPESVISGRGEAIYGRAGCLYGSRDYRNSFSIIDIDPQRSEVIFRVSTWQPTLDRFDDGSDVALGGVLALPLPRRSDEPRPLATYTSIKARLALQVAELSLIQEDKSIDRLDQLLVEPRLFPLPFEQATAASVLARSRPSNAFSVSSLDPGTLFDHRVVIVSGESLSGVTSTLFWLLDQVAERTAKLYPLYIRFDNQIGKDRLAKQIHRALVEQGIERRPDDTLSEICVAIDDISPVSELAAERLADHIERHEANRYVIGAHGNNHSALVSELEKRGIRYKMAYLGPFGRPHARKLAKQVFSTTTSDYVDHILDVAFKHALPRTPFILSALMTVLRMSPSAQVPNESLLLEALLELLLGKSELVSMDRGEMDYRAREHLLGWLAIRFIDMHRDQLPRLEIEGLIGRYFLERGIEPSHSPGNQLNDLIRRRVLMETNGYVEFRHKALRDVLAAKMLLENHEFRAAIESDLLAHSSIVSHAASLRRSETDLLKAVEHFAGQIIASFQVSGPQVIAFIDSRHPGGDTEPESLVKLIPSASPPSPDDHDRQMDEWFERREVEATTDRDPEGDPRPHKQLARSTALLSQVLAGSDLVDDNALKAESLKAAIEGWSKLGALASSTETSAELVRVIRGIIEEADAENEVSAEDVQSLLGFLIVFGTGVAAVATLNGRGLASAVREVVSDSDFQSDPLQALYSTMIYCWLEVDGWERALEELYRRHGNSATVRITCRALALTAYLSPSTTDGVAHRLEEFLTRTVDLSVSGRDAVQQRASAKNEIVASLRQERSRHQRTSRSEHVLEALIDDE